MKTSYQKLAFIILIILVISACTPGNQPAQVVEDYLHALVTKDVANLSVATCSEWTEAALLEMDSFQAVEVTLQDLLCEQIGSDGETELVNCIGSIVTSYNGEQQQFDLSLRTYQVVKVSGEYLVCGYR